MRETKLFSYLPSAHIEESPSVFISVPSAASPQPLQYHNATWAGLTDQVVSWRVVENGTIIILENIISNEALKIVFSSPICCRPSLFSSQPQTITLVVACHADVSGSTLLYLELSSSLRQPPPTPHVVEKLRHFIPSALVTSIHPDEQNAIISLSDGRCARFILDSLAPPPHLFLFSNSFPKSRHARISGSRTSSAFHPSAAPISSFVNRFFTPRASTNRSNLPGSSVRNSIDTLPPHTGPSDPIIAITTDMDPNRQIAASLHASATISIYSLEDSIYTSKAETVLPCKLSTAPVHHFLQAGPDSSFLAVVMADEHPKADSLRVYQITVNFKEEEEEEGTMSLQCSQVVLREGPIPPLLSAAFFAEDVVVATRTGTVAALINEPVHVPNQNRKSVPGASSHTNVAQQDHSTRPLNDSDNQTPPSRGLPQHTLWTALEDVDEPYGLGRSLDEITGDYETFFSAHRFSPQVVGKALRLDDDTSVSHQSISKALKALESIGEDESELKRIKTRAEQLMKRDELKVRDLSWDEQVGLIVCRENDVYVMRPLFEEEKRVHPYHEGLLSCDQLTPRGPTAWKLASHTVCQIFASSARECVSATSTMNNMNFILGLIISFSEVCPEVPLTDLLSSRRASISATNNESISFHQIVEDCKDMMKPGADLITNLLLLNEMTMLGKIAEYCVVDYPVSSTFANGVVWMERFLKCSETDSEVNVDLFESDGHFGDDTVPGMLKKAFGFFSLAAESCNDTSRKDVVCALGLAGYLQSLILAGHSAGLIENGMVDNDDDWRDVIVPIDSEQQDVEGGNQNDSIRLGDCAFWLLERSLKLIERYAPKTAAAIALKAMGYAPDKQQHERMRAAAFSRFLEAGELEHAHKAILSAPFQESDGKSAVTKEEADALKDSIGLFINITADRNELKWLAEQNLPEPLKVLCGQALERRARGMNVINFSAIAKRFLEYKNVNQEVQEDFEISLRDASDTREYEDVFSWHLMREDYASVAQCALEWAERAAIEGPELIREVVQRIAHDQGLADEVEIYLILFLEWAEIKREALGCVLSAMRLLPAGHQYVARSRFSLGSKHETREDKSNNEMIVVDVEWVSRRLLLAQSQKVYFTDMIIEHRSGDVRVENIEHLTAESSPLLGENRSGVEWTCRMMRTRSLLTYDRMMLCAELSCAWREEIGDSCVSEVVSDAAKCAMRKEEEKFKVKDLEKILNYVNGICGQKRVGRRNWNLLAMEQTLLSRGGKAKCPEWLLNNAAFEADGDLLGVTKVFLKYGRAIEAAQILIGGIEKAEEMKANGKRFYISYTAIDATLQTLSKLRTKYMYASAIHDRLHNTVRNHLNVIQSH